MFDLVGGGNAFWGKVIVGFLGKGWLNWDFVCVRGWWHERGLNLLTKFSATNIDYIQQII